jgi:hypothetical protein
LVSHWLQFETDEPFVPNLKKFGFVYLIINTQNGKGYVGCKQYLIGKAKTNSKWETYMGSSKYLKEDIKKIGKKHFRFEVIAEYINKRSLRYYEAHYQMKWDVLTATIEGTDEPAFYNSYVGGKFYRPVESYTIGEKHHMFGRKHTEETKKKISEMSKGRKHTEETKKKISKIRKGKKHTEESKKKMSEAQIGRKHTEEHIKKIAERNFGRKHTEETKRKMSEAHKGFSHTEESKKRMSEAQRIRRKEEKNGN